AAVARGKGGGRGVPWLGLGLLIVIGVAVLTARSMGFARNGAVAPSTPVPTRATPQSAVTHAPTRQPATPVPAVAHPKPTPTVPAVAAKPTLSPARASPE